MRALLITKWSIFSTKKVGPNYRAITLLTTITACSWRTIRTRTCVQSAWMWRWNDSTLFLSLFPNICFRTRITSLIWNTQKREERLLPRTSIWNLDRRLIRWNGGLKNILKSIFELKLIEYSQFAFTSTSLTSPSMLALTYCYDKDPVASARALINWVILPSILLIFAQ